MGEVTLRGKSLAAIARDVAEGYFFVTPLVLKKFDPEAYKDLYFTFLKLQKEFRGEQPPAHAIAEIRKRAMRLQRLANAIVVLAHTAREKRIPL